MDAFVLVVVDIRGKDVFLAFGRRWLNGLMETDYRAAADLVWPPDEVVDLAASPRFGDRVVAGYRVPQSLKDEFADFARRKHIWFC